MNGTIRHRVFRSVFFMAALPLMAVSVKADPIAVGSTTVYEFGTISAITLAILAEAVCIRLLLRRWRTPRLFILWLMAMHLLTYPIFLALLWLAAGAHPAAAVAACEGLIVLLEGSLVYLLCRFAPSAKLERPSPTAGKALFASLVGNICSAAAFPLLTLLNAWIAYAFHRSGMD